MSARNPALDHLPAAAWTALIGVALTIPAGSAADLAGFLDWVPWLDSPGADKVVHVALFFVLAALLARSFRALGWRRALAAAVVAAAAYGAGLEVVQGLFTDRTAEAWDAAADLGGAGGAAVLVLILRRRRAERTDRPGSAGSAGSAGPPGPPGPPDPVV